MIGHYRGRNLTRRVRPRNVTAGPNLYDPSSPGYAERSATHVTDLGNGMVRIDVGTPPPRLPSETQPVREGRRAAAPKAPAVPRKPAPEPATAPSPAAAERLRNHRAITRDP